MKYGAIKKLVGDSIAARICTADGIRRFVENAASGEISSAQFDGVLERMRFEKEITLCENGAFPAYFPADNLPTGFFRAGGGKVTAVYDNPKIGLPVTVISFEVTENSLTLGADEDIEVTKFFTDDDLRQIENLAAENLSNREIAARLEVTERLFSTRARSHLPTRQAISDGHQKRRHENERVAAASAKHTAVPSSRPAPRRPKPRVCDLRPMPAPVAAEPSETETTEQPTRQRRSVEKPPRLCPCGAPLGARTKICKNCWLKRKGNPAVEAKPGIETATDRKIKEILKNENFDREKLFHIAADLFLEFSPAAVKEKLAARLLEEIEAANAAKQGEKYEH